jgi:Uma2 family endonuclease
MSEVSTRYVYYFEGEYLDEDQMPETPRQHIVANYLEDVLAWYFRSENYIVSGNINIYRKGNWGERVAPDVMVIKNAGITQEQFEDLKSYAISLPKQPAPAVAIEIVSASTAPVDLDVAKKPTRYGELGVKEYFAFDPDISQNVVKLTGWRYIDKLRTDIKTDNRGWMWSNELHCWLVSGGKILRFFDQNGNELLTRGEAERQAREAEALAREAEQRARLEAEKVAEQNKRAKEETEKMLETERQTRKAEKAEAERQLLIERLAKEEAEKRTEAERLAREVEKAEAERQLQIERNAKEEAERLIAELRAKLKESEE